SSSAHTALLPWLMGWRYGELDARQRNHFEVALHAGTVAALLLGVRRGRPPATLRLGARQLRLAVLASAPPALAGYLLERRLERRLRDPRKLASGLALGGAALALAGRCAEARTQGEATACDALLLGFAQALALLPGVSRNGAALTVARLRGF